MSGNKCPLQSVEVTAYLATDAFVTRWSHETGGEVSLCIQGRMRFSHEMGYLRGYGGGLLARGEDVGAAEQARFTAREFVARWSRETDEGAWSRAPGEESVIDRMRFAYEMGYLQGHGAGVLAPVGLHNKSDRNVDDAEHE